MTVLAGNSNSNILETHIVLAAPLDVVEDDVAVDRQMSDVLQRYAVLEHLHLLLEFGKCRLLRCTRRTTIRTTSFFKGQLPRAMGRLKLRYGMRCLVSLFQLNSLLPSAN